MSVTLKQIAQHLGLHVSTVSRALHDHPNIARDTVDRIQALALELGYEPNLNAIRFRTGRSMIIGIVVPRLANLFYESFIESVEEEARRKGYTVMLLQSMEDPAIEIENIKLLQSYKVDAMLISPTIHTTDYSEFLEVQKEGIPIILFDSVPSNYSIPKVLFDNHKIGVLAAEYVIKRQCCNVLGIFCNDDNSVITRDRMMGFNEVINKTNSRLNLKAYYHNTVSDSLGVVLKAIREGEVFDAIFCASDNALIGALKALEHAKYIYSKECALVTVSNGLIPTLFDLDISIIETRGCDLGKAAIDQALNAIDGRISNEVIMLDVGIKEPKMNQLVS